MTYRCGFGPGIPGIEPGPPMIICDGCGAKLVAKSKSGGPPSWLLKQKAPRGWRMRKVEEFRRLDWCPACVANGIPQTGEKCGAR